MSSFYPVRQAPNDQEYESRLWPHNLEAEYNTLGALLFDPENIGQVDALLKDDHFYSQQNKNVYKTIKAIYRQNGTVDPVLLKDQLERDGQLEYCGGSDYIAGMVTEVFSTAHVLQYARIVRDCGIRREMVKNFTNCIQLARDGKDQADIVLNQAADILMDIQNETTPSKPVAMSALIEVLLEKCQKKELPPSVNSGFLALDAITDGFRQGEMVVCGARPGVGKSTFLLTIARQAAVNDRTPSLIFNCEMDEEQIATNLMASEANIETKRLMKRELSDADWNEITLAQGRLSRAPIELVNNSKIHKTELYSIAKRWARQQDNMGIIGIDYLQILGSDGGKSREREVAEWSGMLKALARETKMPVLVLSQINRDVCKDGVRPQLHHLRESGAIEQDADVVILLEEVTTVGNDDTELNKYCTGKILTRLIKAHVAKNRSGRVASFDLYFKPHMSQFKDHVERMTENLKDTQYDEYDYKGETKDAQY